MAVCFFSRRAYRRAKEKFSNNRAAQTRHVKIDALSDTIGKGSIIDRDQWVDAVIGQANGGDVLCFVHGFNTSQMDMLRRQTKIERNLKAQGFHGTVIAFDWPSNGIDLDYYPDRNDAKKTAPSIIVDGLGPIMNHPAKPKIHLLAHSMGALVVLRGFAATGDGAGGRRRWSVDQVIFAGADLDQKDLGLGVSGSLVMKQRCARLTNYYSESDRVLDLADGLVNGGRKRLGRHGLPDPTEREFDDVDCRAQYDAKVPSGDKTFRGSHTWYFDNTGFARDVADTLSGKPASAIPTRRGVSGRTDQELFG